MKYYVIFMLLFMTNAYGQKPSSMESLKKDIEKMRETGKHLDTTTARLNESIAETMAESKRKMDSVNREMFQKQNERSLNSFFQQQRERQQKEKQRMWLRLGFGIAMLGLGIFALVRRRKK